MNHADDIVSEKAFACSPEVSAELSATLVGRELGQRGAVHWFDVRQVDRRGRVRWVTRGVWPGRSEAGPRKPEAGRDG